MLILTLLLLPYFIFACKGGGSSGCCKHTHYHQNVGGGGGQCGGGCQPGYSCGSYGCAKRRALGGLTRRMDGLIVADENGEQAFTPPLGNDLITDVSKLNLTRDRLTNPNFIFHTCCQTRGLPDACLKHCHFNTYSAHALENMFRGNDRCPIDAANEIHFCAAQGLDHKRCCSADGVAATMAGRKCLAFCDQTPNRFTKLDMSYLPCLGVFESMKRCFYNEIRARAEAKFGDKEVLAAQPPPPPPPPKGMDSSEELTAF